MTVGVHVLAEQGDLLGTLDDQLRDLVDNVLRPAALFAPAAVGNDAISTEVVTALNYGDEGGRAFGW